MDTKLNNKARRYATLLAGYMRETLTPDELDELDEWVGASDKNMRLFEELTDKRRVKLALAILNDTASDQTIHELAMDITPIRRFNWKTFLNRVAMLFVLAWAIVGMVHVIRELP